MNPSITAGHFDDLLCTERAEKPTETPKPSGTATALSDRFPVDLIF